MYDRKRSQANEADISELNIKCTIKNTKIFNDIAKQSINSWYIIMCLYIE